MYLTYRPGDHFATHAKRVLLDQILFYNKPMANPQPELAEFSGDEFIQVGEIARSFWERGISEDPPKFVIVMGGIAAGKTTIRRHHYERGYVHFDYGEICKAVVDVVGRDHERFPSYASLACDLVLRESLATRKFLVIEIIGESLSLITPIIQAMRQLGYGLSVNAIEADPGEARARHLRAVKADSTYSSSYFSQEPTMAVFYHVLRLGDMPAVSDVE
jgi:hypothetical protein